MPGQHTAAQQQCFPTDWLIDCMLWWKQDLIHPIQCTSIYTAFTMPSTSCANIHHPLLSYLPYLPHRLSHSPLIQQWSTNRIKTNPVEWEMHRQTYKPIYNNRSSTGLRINLCIHLRSIRDHPSCRQSQGNITHAIVKSHHKQHIQWHHRKNQQSTFNILHAGWATVYDCHTVNHIITTITTTAHAAPLLRFVC